MIPLIHELLRSCPGIGEMIGQAREDVGEPGLRIDVVELGDLSIHPSAAP
jgi:hypothetical protein